MCPVVHIVDNVVFITCFQSVHFHFTNCLTSLIALKSNNDEYVSWNCGLSLKEMKEKYRTWRIVVIRICPLGGYVWCTEMVSACGI